MAEFRWSQMSLFLILVLQFKAGQLFSCTSVRDGDEVTLPCESVRPQEKCDSTQWLFSDARFTGRIELAKNGKIVENSKLKDALRLTENCSLVIKKTTLEDVGRYDCQQIRPQQQGANAVVLLYVVTMTEQKDGEEVTLNCSMTTYERCRHAVKWLFKSQAVDKNNQQMRTSQSPCYTSVTILTSHFSYTSRHELFTCEATCDGGRRQVFPFSPRPSGETPGKDTTTATTKPTTTATSENSIKTDLLVFIVLALVSVALLIIIVAVVVWKRSKKNKTLLNDNIGMTSNPAASQSAPETSQDTADPEDGVSYASVSYTKKTDSKAKVQRNDYDDDGGGDAVTYTMVKASSADPNNLYATLK